MPESLKIIILAIVQGIAEFLPISSSGHLAVLENYFHINPDNCLGMIIVLHAGTLLAIVVYYIKTLLGMMRPENWGLILKIIVGTIPVAISGMVLHFTGLDESLFNNLIIVGIGFLITSLMLLLGVKSKPENTIELRDLSFKGVLFIGIIQCLALLPGVSRAGSTISAGLRWGLQKNDTATFSFLLAIPAIGGAVFVKVLSAVIHNNVDLQSTGLYNLFIGFCISAITGYIALLILLKCLRKGKLAIFAYYCMALGFAVVSWGISKMIM